MILGIIVLISFDLLTKWLAERYFVESVEIIKGFLKLDLAYNTGVAFSIPIPNGVMIFLTPLLLAVTVWLISRSINMENRISQIAVTFMIAGGLGNLISRILNGAVIDFIDFSFWPSFNLADTYLVTGALLIIVFYNTIHGKIMKANLAL